MKTEKFWLIQRGKFMNTEGTALLCERANRVIDFDYMGAAEFEWGAIPRAYRRIFNHFDRYQLHTLDFTTIRGVPVHLFCRDDKYDAIVAEIKRYIEKPYQLKEYSGIADHFREDGDRYRMKTNFWWCIDNTEKIGSRWDRPEYIGDFMLFIGATDRKNAFLRVINKEYNEWWMEKSEEDRSKEINEAYRH